MSSDQNEIFKGRIAELARASGEKGRFMFSDFLTPAERSFVLQNRQALSVSAAFFGGYENAERVMVRFGSAEELGYDAEFPIKILHISPLNKKFSDELSHRDFLGAILNLGIDRKLTGDILTNGTEAYVFTEDHIAGFIAESLTRVKHTSVSVCETASVAEGIIKQPEQIFAAVPSLRLDAVISKVYNLPRSRAQSLLNAEKVFVNSCIQTRASYVIKENDLVSVRGLGRFRYICSMGETRKGNIKLIIESF